MVDLCVGCRIESSGDIGTVKFIGLIPPTNGEWIGVEWDDPTRGKHDGSKDGVQYFTCKHSTGGSFVRSSKLNTGVSICQAIKEKYIQTDVSDNNATDDDLYFTSNSGGLKKVEAIGMDSVQKQFAEVHRLTQIGLRNQYISHDGEPGSLSSLAPNVVEVDLSKNLLSSWTTVGNIAKQLPRLQILNLSENLLSISLDALKCPSAFASLHTLVLNKCQLVWDQLLTCAVMWPQLRQLYISANHITEITTPSSDLFTCLESLNLSENPIASWDDIRKLNVLPKLSSLSLDNCGLSKISVRSDEFSCLKYISLVKNKFETLQVFNEINKFPAVDNLTFRGNPVLQLEEYRTMVEIIVAKIGKLRTFNRSKVDDEERRSAELDYLRKYGLEWKSSGGHQDPELNKPSEEFIEDHPRYLELAEIYGAPGDHQLIKKSTAIKGNLIEVVIEAPSKPEFQPITRQLPLTMTVGNLKLLLQKLTKIEVRKQRLVYVSKDDESYVVDLHRDFETLHDVSIEPLDRIQVRQPLPNNYYRFKSKFKPVSKN